MAKRPFSVTLSIWLVLILTTWNALRLWTSIAWRDVLVEYPLRMPPAASAVAGGLWFIIGGILAWGLWRDKMWTAKWLRIAALCYSAWYWSERLVWENPQPNSTFAAAATLACLTLIFIATKSMSREAYERNTENPATE